MALEIGERRRMEDEVRQVEERYRRLVENMPGIAYIWEVRPGVTRAFGYVSPRLQDVLGFTTEEWQALRLTASTLTIKNGWKRPSPGARRSGESFLMEYRFLAKDGSVVWVLDHASLISRDEGGSPRRSKG